MSLLGCVSSVCNLDVTLCMLPIMIIYVIIYNIVKYLKYLRTCCYCKVQFTIQVKVSV